MFSPPPLKLIASISEPTTAEIDSTSGWDQVPAILQKIVPPVFPEKDFNILDYGAVGDGKTDCSQAFKQAIEGCSSKGGGRVVIPSGIFLTGAIHLKSNVNLYVSPNSTILFSQNPRFYLPLVHTRFEGVECMNYSPFIYAYGQENIAITGKGTDNRPVRFLCEPQAQPISVEHTASEARWMTPMWQNDCGHAGGPVNGHKCSLPRAVFPASTPMPTVQVSQPGHRPRR